MQESLNLLAAKCEELGFTISHTKTKAMSKTRATPPTQLQLQGQDIDWVATHRYLGVIVARTNTCKAEIHHLKDKCRARNRILKALSWRGMGASGKVILSAYKALVRALIDYASLALLNITSTDAKSLKTVQNKALRTALGAPRWTKVENLRAEAQLPSLTQRITSVTANFLIKTSIKGHPDQLYTLLHNHRGQCGQGRWLTRALDALHRSGVTWETITAATIPTEDHPAPPWQEPVITTIVNPPRRRKNLCVQAELRQEGLHSISDAQGSHTATYFTDGSTDPVTGRSGAAYVCRTGDEGVAAGTTITASARISNFSSSTQSELAAIAMALEHAHTSQCPNVVIATDSMTAIAAIKMIDGENILQTRAIQGTARTIHAAGRCVTITWIPSHVGISGNEEADALAKRATNDATVATVTPRTLHQLRGAVKLHVEGQRHQEQSNIESESVSWFNRVATGCPPPTRHPPSRLCEVVTSRIRLGYPYPWQLGLVTTEEEKQCRLCRAHEGHTLEHYLRDCGQLSRLRQQCPVPSPTLPELAQHFIKILPQTLSEHPQFCAIK